MSFLPDQFGAAFLSEMRSLRLERNWTQSELARRTNGAISASTLAGYESGHRRIRLEAAWTLATALDMKLSTLIAHAENSMVRSDGTRLDVERLLQTSDPLLEPVRRWLAVAHTEQVDPHPTFALTGGALAALSALMGVEPEQCRTVLAPYLGTIKGSPRPSVTGPDNGVVRSSSG